MTSRSRSRSSSPSIVDLDEPVGDDGRRCRPCASAGDELVAARTDVDGDGAGAFEQRVGRARHDEPAGVDHHDVVAHLLHVVEQVRGHQHRDAERAEPGDEREHVLAAERVEAARSARRAAPARDRRRSPARASCAAACRSRTRRSAGSGPRRARRGRGCRTRAGARHAPAARSARRTSTTTSAAVWSSGRQSCSGM